MKIFSLTVSTALLGTACSSLPEVPPANFSEPLPAVAAQYQTVQHCAPGAASAHTTHTGPTIDQQIDWRFFRSAQRLTIENLSAHTGEDWQRDGNTIFMRKLFHDDRKAVEYRSEDLNVLNIEPQWRYKALLIDPAELEQLGAPRAYWDKSIPLYRYQGEIDGTTVQLEWRGDLGIPVRIERTAGNCEEITELQQASALQESPWPLPAIDEYQLIDYSDIGDMERDPFVQKVFSQLPGGEVHTH